MVDTATTRARLQNSIRSSPGSIVEVLTAQMPVAEHAATGLWRRDPALWSDDPTVQKTIANRLGWLTSPHTMAGSIERIRTFADGIRRSGFTDIVLLGMGGSSLAPEVLRAVLGVSVGWPRFHMLDSTDPAAVGAISTSPERTLFILASKSGTTIEPNSLAAHFRSMLETSGVPNWADHFVAITDEGTALDHRARTDRFREVFINPSDIGGRYSAMSLFGLVPAALMGQDVGALVGWATAMLEAAEADDATTNPAVALGWMMGSGALAGCDKLTLLMPPALEPFGLWVEQLVAESTGKQGVGVVPIVSEGPSLGSAYRTDRLFVHLRLGGAGVLDESELAQLKAGNHPVVELEVTEPVALGAEFVRWEVATAIAGAILQINPFDEPNVQQAKDRTRGLLDRYQSTGRLPVPSPDRTLADGTTLRLSEAARRDLHGSDAEAILMLLNGRTYFALLAYLGPDAGLADVLRVFRMSVRDRTRSATMFGYGPRYLHSTGQLHKGGPNTGIFVLITARPAQDLGIPGQAFSFATLELAQALGDFASLDEAGRAALHVHLPAPDVHLIRRVSDRLLSHLPARQSV